jgi:hypothetical protein
VLGYAVFGKKFLCVKGRKAPTDIASAHENL